jgi:phage tail sheath protein FI
MRPGIVVQYARAPDRTGEQVRSDVAGIIGFVPPERWPEGATAGDYSEVLLRRKGDLWEHPDRDLFDPAARQAAEAFFENGGDMAYVFGVCLSSLDELRSPASAIGVLAPLFDRLRAEDDIAILLVPGAAYLRCEVSRDGQVRADAEVLYDELLAHCREMNNRFLIMDVPKGLHGELLLRWIRAFRKRDPATRSYGAIYYPWLMKGDEVHPPSGAVAGTFSRIEAEHAPFGVSWPPANTPILGVTHTEVELDWQEAGVYAEESVNPIVVQQGRGIVAFGARTLSVDPNFMFINSRRIVNMVTEQLRRDSEWAVFETNNPHLWNVLERDVRFRMSEFAGAGLLEDRHEGEGYLVKCDEETNLNMSRDLGQVQVQISMRPIGTVETIVVDLKIGDNGPRSM